MDDEPLGTPTQLAPRVVEPLFTPTQVKELEASQVAASHLYGGPRVLQGLGPVEELPRPKFLEGERLKALPQMESTATGTPSPVDFATLLKVEENAPLLKMVMGLYTENQKLKQEAELRGGHGGPRGPAGGADGGRQALPLRDAGHGLHRRDAGHPGGEEGLHGGSRLRDGAGSPGQHGRASMARTMLSPAPAGGGTEEFETPEEEGRGGLGQERKDLYSLTPMEQFEKLQMMMDQGEDRRGHPDA